MGCLQILWEIFKGKIWWEHPALWFGLSSSAAGCKQPRGQSQCSRVSPVLHQNRETLLLGCTRGCRVIRAHLKGFSSLFFLPKTSTVILEAKNNRVKCTRRQQQLSQHVSILLVCSLWFFKWIWKTDCPYPVCSRLCTWGYCYHAHAPLFSPSYDEAFLKYLPMWSSIVPQQSYSRNCFLIRLHGHTRHDLGS